MKIPTDGPERRRPAGWDLALNHNGYSFGNAAETANAAHFLLFKARRAIS